MRRSSIFFALAAMFSLGTPEPTRAGAFDMDALWPNEDGRSWTYAARTENYEELPPSISDRTVRMFLEGTVVAPDAITVQMLRGELLSGPVAFDALTARIPDPLMRAIHRARPDLRSAIEARVEGVGCSVVRADGFDGLMLSAELTYLKTATEIASWRCNATNLRAWRWLVADLTLGNTFTLPLVPDLAPDILLHGTIAAVEDVVVPAGTIASCLRVDYRIDYGLTECTDESGTPLGTARSETRGSVHYAMGIGPVASFEEFIPDADGTGTCPLVVPAGEPLSRITMKLASLPVAVVPATWGQLKSRYR